MTTILIVDDDPTIRRVLEDLLKKEGFNVLSALNVDAALPLIDQRDLDLIVTDLKMPGKSGMDLLTAVRERRPSLPVIMITAFGNVDAAVTAMKKGAYDFITKPFDENELLNVIEKAISESELNRELLSTYFDQEPQFSQIIGQTPKVQEILQTIKKIAPTDSTVLITGETGVGKELIAQEIHLKSPRRDHPFVKVNCAAIPETLMESELFGYEKGAFTGAVTNKPGRFELAHKGTILLDEIGEMALHLQAKLLEAIQDKSFNRVGGIKTIKVDARIIAATNQDLQSAIQAGKFRSDLYYRLNVVLIQIPPLRERKEDLVPLINYFLKKFSMKYKKRVENVSPEVMASFSHYHWPGNIRELENVLERMVLMSESETLTPDQLPAEIRGTAPHVEAPTLKEKIEAISHLTEKQMIIEALNKMGQNRTRTARLLGISRRTLQNKIKEYGL